VSLQRSADDLDAEHPEVRSAGLAADLGLVIVGPEHLHRGPEHIVLDQVVELLGGPSEDGVLAVKKP
jgi:hypothetical protein